MGQALIGAALNIYSDAWWVTEPRKIEGSFLIVLELSTWSTLYCSQL